MNISNYHCLPEKTEPCCTKTKKTPLKATPASKSQVALFEMQPNGYSALHNHKTHHTLYVVQGEGAIFDGEKLTPLHPDDVAFIQADETHQIKNVGRKPFKFISITGDAKQ